MERLDLSRQFIETHAFIEEHVLPDLGWPAFEAILRALRQRRIASPGMYTDLFPTLACVAAGGEVARAIPLSASWLLYVLAARIFDDHQDEEGENQPWSGTGREALGVGLFALGAAQSALFRLEADLETLRQIGEAYGNVLAMAARAQSKGNASSGVSVEQYFTNMAAKTGIVFATAAWSGARVSTLTPSDLVLDSLYNYGLNVGMTIQITDDCRDLAADDLKRGDFTLPVIYALAQREHPCQPQLAQLMAQAGESEHTEAIIEILEEMGAINWSRRVASVYRSRALAALEPLDRERTIYLEEYVSGYGS